MTTVFAVVGEHHEDRDRLLLLGDDGQHYDLRLPDGAPSPIRDEPDTSWTIDDYPAADVPRVSAR